MKQDLSRRGAVHPGVILALLVFLGMMAWALMVNWNAIDPRVLGNHGLRSRAVGNTVAMTLLLLAVCGGVTTLVYFVSAKSMQVANIALMVLLLLSCVFPARRLYLLWEAIDRRAQLATGNSPDGSSSGSGGSNPGSSSTTYVVPRPAAPTPQPFNATPSPAGGTQPNGSSPAAVAPVMPVAPPPPPAPPFDGKPVLDKLRTEYAAKCEALAMKAEAAYAAAAKPKKVNQFLDEWIEKFNTLKAEAEVLEAEIRELSMRGAREALEKAGAPLGDAASQAIVFGEEFNTFQRQVACGEISRCAEQGAELFTIIKENFAKVQIDAKGEATSKDRAVETKLFHARSQLGFAVKRKDETLKKVRGKE